LFRKVCIHQKNGRSTIIGISRETRLLNIARTIELGVLSTSSAGRESPVEKVKREKEQAISIQEKKVCGGKRGEKKQGSSMQGIGEKKV